MPFDGAQNSDRLKLSLAREGVERAWQKGDFGLQGAPKHCVVGWLLEACSWDLEAAAHLISAYVYPALRRKPATSSRVRAVYRFNDAPGRRKGDVLRLLDRAMAKGPAQTPPVHFEARLLRAFLDEEEDMQFALKREKQFKLG